MGESVRNELPWVGRAGERKQNFEFWIGRSKRLKEEHRDSTEVDKNDRNFLPLNIARWLYLLEQS